MEVNEPTKTQGRSGSWALESTSSSAYRYHHCVPFSGDKQNFEVSNLTFKEERRVELKTELSLANNHFEIPYLTKFKRQEESTYFRTENSKLSKL